jgi:hypothetical protein
VPFYSAMHGAIMQCLSDSDADIRQVQRSHTHTGLAPVGSHHVYTRVMTECIAPVVLVDRAQMAEQTNQDLMVLVRQTGQAVEFDKVLETLTCQLLSHHVSSSQACTVAFLHSRGLHVGGLTGTYLIC